MLSGAVSRFGIDQIAKWLLGLTDGGSGKQNFLVLISYHWLPSCYLVYIVLNSDFLIPTDSTLQRVTTGLLVDSFWTSPLNVQSPLLDEVIFVICWFVYLFVFVFKLLSRSFCPTQLPILGPNKTPHIIAQECGKVANLGKVEKVINLLIERFKGVWLTIPIGLPFYHSTLS